MATPANEIRVPDPATGSYQPDRPAGKLLQSQALHLREALVQQLQELSAVLAVNPTTLKTEREVSQYVHRATAILHAHAAKPKRK
jgi:hypothetical protein